MVQEAVYDQYRDIDILFMENDGYVIELVTPKSENSVVANLIKKYKNAPYHFCYISDCFEDDIQCLEKSGFTKIDEALPAPALGGNNVCFLFSSKIGLIEIFDNKGEEPLWH